MLGHIESRPLSGDGPITSRFRAAGIDDFVGAARHLLALPYGRIADRARFWLVLEEGRGTCTSKHALLAALAREQGIDVQLMLGIYEMSATGSSTRSRSRSIRSAPTRSRCIGGSWPHGSRGLERGAAGSWMTSGAFARRASPR
jgi:hypothetical protein